ncbi:hypothetical protein JW935_18300 [candidate division KSB1 bacterium]|nr:hypothetical protein [candidate division KSB1 bacterium]
MSAPQDKFNYKSDFLSGFEKEIRGETINYFTLKSQAFDALLVRSLNAADYIEWDTQPVPLEGSQATLTFVMLASLQVTTDSFRFDFYMNEVRYFTIENPRDILLTDIAWQGPAGAKLEYKYLSLDKYNDLTGFLFLHLPAKKFPKGKPIRVKVQGESAASRSWFMVFKHPCRSDVTFYSENVILNSTDAQKQSLRIKIVHMTAPTNALVRIGTAETRFSLKFGFNSFSAGLDMLSRETELPLLIKIGKKSVVRTTLNFKPVVPLTIYLLPHSHVDIGYTHVQNEVKKLQWQHLENAVALAEQSQKNQENARFKWNAEVLWAVGAYLASADTEKRRRLIDAVKKGWIGIDGLFANILTGLCSPEEWIWLAHMAEKTAKMCGIKIESAMITDIPGWSWSIVPVLAQAGMKYLSCGINQGDRIGSIRRELGDKPFYWLSPSGKEKVLTWVHEQGYSAFHYVPQSGSVAGLSVIEPAILNYVNQLAEESYPFDKIPLRYTIGSDNGPPDRYLADHVKTWNELYASPKLVIATTVEFFRQFEKKYGDELPVMKGDITPYWEDGAASSARETALNRQSAAKLHQALMLFTQYKPESCPVDLFADAWRNVHLSNEHTWGSWNSVSEPESALAAQQWKKKQVFIQNAFRQAEALLNQAIEKLAVKTKPVEALDVFNTTSVKRSDLVNIPEYMKADIQSGLSLVGETEGAVLLQQLSDGSMVFLAREIPAWGSKRYFVKKGQKTQPFEPAVIRGNTLENEFIRLEIDIGQGTIDRLVYKERGNNLVDHAAQYGFGSYLYVNGRRPDKPMGLENVKVKVKEEGPIVSSWLVKAGAPGCHSLEYEIRLIAGKNDVYLNYAIDKKKIYTPEAVRIAFPFFVPDGVVHIEDAFGFYRPESDQIKGSCKNFFTVNNYVDIANSEYGVTFVSVDTPLIEIGAMTNDASAVGWLETARKGSCLYSYLMNNYWHTNYCATQEGEMISRYILCPHKNFDPAIATAQGIFARQPLIVVPVAKNTGPYEPLVRYDNENVFIVSLQPLDHGRKVWMALYNAAEKNTELRLDFKTVPQGLYASDLLKNKGAESGSLISIPGRGLRCVLVER